MKYWYSNGDPSSRRDCPVIRWCNTVRIWIPLLLLSDSVPFNDWTQWDHLNTGLVCYSYPHCPLTTSRVNFTQTAHNKLLVVLKEIQFQYKVCKTIVCHGHKLSAIWMVFRSSLCYNHSVKNFKKLNLVKYCDALGSCDATTAAIDGFSPMSLGDAWVTSAPKNITCK